MRGENMRDVQKLGLAMLLMCAFLVHLTNEKNNIIRELRGIRAELHNINRKMGNYDE